MSDLEHNYWLINGDQFLEALNRVNDGEDPEVVYAELYATADIEPVEGK